MPRDGITELVQPGIESLVHFRSDATFKINLLIDTQQPSEVNIDRLADSLHKLIDLQDPNGR
jgi:hypothetical protein